MLKKKNVTSLILCRPCESSQSRCVHMCDNHDMFRRQHFTALYLIRSYTLSVLSPCVPWALAGVCVFGGWHKRPSTAIDRGQFVMCAAQKARSWRWRCQIPLVCPSLPPAPTTSVSLWFLYCYQHISMRNVIHGTLLAAPRNHTHLIRSGLFLVWHAWKCSRKELIHFRVNFSGDPGCDQYFSLEVFSGKEAGFGFFRCFSEGQAERSCLWL